MSDTSIHQQHTTQPAPTVVIIGGGITGAGIARDAALRGFRVVLVEQNELGSGTSGHFHGMLHSGARYAVHDVSVASECYQENQILRKIAGSTITDTGGLFVALNEAEARHADVVKKSCAEAGIPTTDLTLEQLRAREPGINPSVALAFGVPDAVIDGAALIELNVAAACAAGIPAQIHTSSEVIGFSRQNGRVSIVKIKHKQSQEVAEIPCDYVVNACGVWAGAIAGMLDIALSMVYDKGTMVEFSHSLTQTVLNRCRPEADGDLLVPGANGKGSVMGTTARQIEDPSFCEATQEEIDLLLKECKAMVPAADKNDIHHVYAGVRPLIKPSLAAQSATTRALSRSYQVIDHETDGVSNLISIIGGKVTIYRLMAEKATDLICHKAGTEKPCQTATLPL